MSCLKLYVIWKHLVIKVFLYLNASNTEVLYIMPYYRLCDHLSKPPNRLKVTLFLTLGILFFIFSVTGTTVSVKEYVILFASRHNKWWYTDNP